jgi:catechol 2,3-dioxygenase-like lactoylglutathione lyase family enzyme
VLQHVTLEVTEDKIRDCVAFWALLGFTEMTPPPRLRGRFTWVEREGTQIHLVPVENPIAARDGHVAVVAPDYDAALRALAQHGCELREGSNAWDAPRTFVRDPVGHLIEVMSAPPHPPFPAA